MQTSSTLGTNTVVAVGATAVQLVDGTTLRRSVIVQNVHATQILYVGSTSGVTTANGLKIAAGDAREFNFYAGPLFGIASGAATDTRVFEIGG